MAAIEVTDLFKSYGPVDAVRGISFRVEEARIASFATLVIPLMVLLAVSLLYSGTSLRTRAISHLRSSSRWRWWRSQSSTPDIWR